MKEAEISLRKSEHLRIVAEEDITFRRPTLLEDVRLLPDALPELDLEEVETRIRFFGKELELPLLCTSMTGGAGGARSLNEGLARAAGATGIAFAVGSQRVMLEHPETAPDFAVRPVLGDGVLLGNIGGQQIPVFGPRRVAELVDAIEADGICVHLNPAHELAQPGGDRRFRGVLDGIAALVDLLEGRVLVKEVGSGLSPDVVARLREAGVRCFDVAGAGGTSWPRVEARRAATESDRAFARAFGEWGIPTAAAIALARRTTGDEAVIVGAGGIRSGLDAARAIALGADLAGMARELLLAFRAGGAEGTAERIRTVGRELRAAMLLAGARTLEDLRRVPRVITGELGRWLEKAPGLNLAGRRTPD